MVQFCHNYCANEWTSKHIKNNNQKQTKNWQKKKITQSKHTEIIHRNVEMLLSKHVTKGTYPSSPLLFLHLQQTYL